MDGFFLGARKDIAKKCLRIKYEHAEDEAWHNKWRGSISW